MRPQKDPRTRFSYPFFVGTLLLILTSFIILTRSYCLPADPVTIPDKPSFRATDFLEPIKYLSSDQLNGRGDGDDELDQAADYIARKFSELKLQPLGDRNSYFQRFSITVSAKLGPNNSIVLKQKQKPQTLKVDEDFRPFAFSSVGQVSGSLLFAGYGITAPEYNYDDYKGVDAKGKIVIVLRHEPQENDEKSVFAGKQFTTYSRIVNKVINAKNHGAVGLILVNDVANHLDESDELIPFGRELGPKDAGIVAMQVRSTIVGGWLSRAGKDLKSLNQAIDRDLSNQSFAFDSSGVLSMRADLNRIQKQVANVIGYLPVQASQNLNSMNECIFIGAHYDHLGRGERSSLAPKEIGMIHHGADDNASGVSGLLLLARELSHQRSRKRSVVFGAFAGEELGLLGSDYYTAHPPLPLDHTIAMINLDMIGRINKNRLYIGGTGTSPNFRDLLEQANKDIGFELNLSASGYGASDHTSFSKHHIPILFFFSGLHSDYHKPSDTWDKIDSDAGVRVVSLVYNVVRRLESLPERPVYVRVAEPAPSAASGSSGYGPYFGSVPDFGEIDHGVRFADIRDNSPAAKAGLKAGDILIEFGGKKIDNLYDFTYALQAHKPGDQVMVVVLRDQQKISRSVTLEKRR